MDYDYDFLDIEPPVATNSTGVWWAESSGSSTQPYIDYTVGVAADNATFFGANF